MQTALRKDLNDCIGQLSASRAELQSAVDAGEEIFIRSLSCLAGVLKALHYNIRQEARMLQSTESSKELITKMQQQVLAYGKKKSFTNK